MYNRRTDSKDGGNGVVEERFSFSRPPTNDFLVETGCPIRSHSGMEEGMAELNLAVLDDVQTLFRNPKIRILRRHFS